MAPEVLAGEKPTPISDVYALAVTAYEALTGRLPLQATSVRDLVVRHVHRDIAKPSSIRPDLPPAFDEVLLRALEGRTDKRFESAIAFGRALDSALSSSGTRGALARRRSTAGGVPKGEHVSLLVVEDDEVLRTLLEIALKRQSFDVTSAADGVEALLRLGSGNFDLILSDINMPHLNGLALMKLLSDKGLNTPVIFLSANPQSDYADELAALRPAGFVSKPFEAKALLEAVRGALGRRES